MLKRHPSKTRSDTWTRRLKNVLTRMTIRWDAYIRHRNIAIGRDCRVSRTTKIGNDTVIYDHVSIVGSEISGGGTYISGHCEFNSTRIGTYCSIGDHSGVIIGSHPTRTYVSTHPAFYSVLYQGGISYVEETTLPSAKTLPSGFVCEIGSDVFIGSYVQILNGVRIGDGSIVAAGSLVTGDVEPYTVVGGVPAKKIRDRFTPEETAFLKKIRWFDWPPEEIAKYSRYFNDIQAFQKAYEEDHRLP